MKRKQTSFFMTIVLFLTIFSSINVIGQNIEWKALNGKWKFQKAVLVSRTDSLRKNDSTDISIDYENRFISYLPDSTYKETQGKIRTIGKYQVNKIKNEIHTIDLALTKKTPGEISSDIYRIGGVNHHIIELTTNKLVFKYIPDSEPHIAHVFYFKKAK